MVKINILKLRSVLYGLAAFALVFTYFSGLASAASITNRKLVIGSSAASASTTYTFTFTLPSSTVIQSASFTACTSANVCGGTPADFSASSATLTSQPTGLGDASGWTVNNSTAGSLRLKKTGNSAAPNNTTTTVGFSNVVNPSDTNSTFYIRITTYSDDNFTTPIDTGVVATSTAGQVTVSVSIDEQLTFTLANSSVVLTTPSVTTAGTGTSTMTLSTNAASGYSLAYFGNTLTSGAHTIDAINPGDVSIPNSRQFGLNLVQNTVPSVGSNKTGLGSATAASGYNVADSFKFLSGDTVASASLPTNTNSFTASYLVNMDGSTPAGAYSTILTYIMTANF